MSSGLDDTTWADAITAAATTVSGNLTCSSTGVYYGSTLTFSAPEPPTYKIRLYAEQCYSPSTPDRSKETGGVILEITPNTGTGFSYSQLRFDSVDKLREFLAPALQFLEDEGPALQLRVSAD